MHGLVIAAIGLSMLAGSVPASATSPFEYEAARIRARAGGPISEYDAWLLEQGGCEPGSKVAFCERLKHRQEQGWSRQNRRLRRDS